MINARSHGNDFLDFRPERVAIQSFRSTMAGYEHGDPSSWDDLWNNLVSECGIDCACIVSGPLQYFVRCLRSARDGGLQYFPNSCRRICADECLVVSLLSAAQHDDAEALEFCLHHLLKDNYEIFSDDLRSATLAASQKLRLSDLVLMPVPVSVLQPIVQRSCGLCRRCAPVS